MTLLLTPRMAAGMPAVAPLPARLSRNSGGVRIGRSSDADLVLADPSSTVSSQHCAVALTPQGWVLADTSTNGTLINGARVAGQQPLRDGDVIRVGPYELLVGLTQGGASAPTGAANPALDNWGRGAAGGATQHVAQQATRGATTAPPQAASGDPVTQLLAAAGLTRAAVPAADAAILAAAGAVLRQAVAGTADMVAARAKARKEMGVAAEARSTNPFKRGVGVDEALAMLLGAPTAAAGAVSEVQAELDAHQRATLAAMQAALRTTLDTFAPAAIKARTGGNPAAAWKAYETAFDAPDGFVEILATEFGKAYASLAPAKTPAKKG